MSSNTATAPRDRARERWSTLVEAVGATVVADGRAEMACPVHGGDKKNKFVISIGDTADYPLVHCRSECDTTDAAWLARASEALLALGAPAECLQPTPGHRPGSAAPTPASRRASGPSAEPTPPSSLPDEQRVYEWHRGLRGQPLLMKTLCDLWQVSEESLLVADVGYKADRDRITFPVTDADTGEVVQVLYRSLTPGAERKVKTHPGVTGSFVYAPFGIDPDRKVLLCAGEHDLFSAHEAGFNAVSFTNGEKAVPAPERLSALEDLDVVVAYDNDAAGRAGAQRAAEALDGIAGSVALADLGTVAGLPEKGDVADVLRLHGVDKLREVLTAAVPWRSAEEDASAGPQPVDWQEFWASDPAPISYHVEPLIAHGEITRLYAQAKVGKSLIVQECAAALAMGRDVLGSKCEPTDVLYIDQENTWDDWKTRLADMGFGPEDDWSRLHWYSLQSWPALDTRAGGVLLLEKVRQHAARIVVIDTQSKVLDGEEDKAPTSAAFYRHTLLPLKRLGVAVVIIDHAGNDGTKPRGSSGKRDDVDVVWQVTPRAKDKLTLNRTHSRKRHSQDVLYINRALSPLRHELASEDQRDEEMVDACMDAILAMDAKPDYDASGNTVIKVLREERKSRGRKGFREATVRAAWARITGREDSERP